MAYATSYVPPTFFFGLRPPYMHTNIAWATSINDQRTQFSYSAAIMLTRIFTPAQTFRQSLPRVTAFIGRTIRSYETATENLGSTMPPNYNAKVGQLETFTLPAKVTGNTADCSMGKALISAWRRDGILQIQMDPVQQGLA